MDFFHGAEGADGRLSVVDAVEHDALLSGEDGEGDGGGVTVGGGGGVADF